MVQHHVIEVIKGKSVFVSLWFCYTLATLKTLILQGILDVNSKRRYYYTFIPWNRLLLRNIYKMERKLRDLFIINAQRQFLLWIYRYEGNT